MTWSREVWREKRKVGRRRFIRKAAVGWYVPTFIALMVIMLAPFRGLTWGRVAWTLLVMVTALPLGAWLLGRFLWWDMERRYPDLGPPT
jgi:hypothetical protein